MLWFGVWTVLVLGTLGGAFLLGRSLWRKGKALLAQLEATSAVLDQLQSRIDELEARREPEPVFAPAVLATEDQRSHWREVREGNRRMRGQRRERRHAQTRARWHALMTGSQEIHRPR